MEEALTRFGTWFIKFVVISLTLLIVTHLFARSLRDKKKTRTNPTTDETQDNSTG